MYKLLLSTLQKGDYNFCSVSPKRVGTINYKLTQEYVTLYVLLFRLRISGLSFYIFTEISVYCILIYVWTGNKRLPFNLDEKEIVLKNKLLFLQVRDSRLEIF